MCLTVPLEVTKIKKQTAELADGRVVNISLVKDVEVGDWILVNANLALAKITVEEAREIIELLAINKK
ncbi:MAG: HypC/HybG/HupF family hydrogenase formation chaperone [Patescibacteria group bacterium]|jgi:hydrogenase assembly chaperone HypC/HupF|nr:HypC/HybG/HupF family hydrogenase formation chaperone [Patescibacteria group bacterium]